jgi:hypothetical protein
MFAVYIHLPAGFNTFCPDGVLVLHDFHKFVKKSVGGAGLSFVLLDSLVLVVSVTVFRFHQGVCVRMLVCHERMFAQHCWDVCLNECLCFIAADPRLKTQ